MTNCDYSKNPIFFEKNRVFRVYTGGKLFSEFFGDDRTLDTHIKILRKSLGKYSDFIVTIRGMGYRFEEKEIK